MREVRRATEAWEASIKASDAQDVANEAEERNTLDNERTVEVTMEIEAMAKALGSKSKTLQAEPRTMTTQVRTVARTMLKETKVKAMIVRTMRMATVLMMTTLETTKIATVEEHADAKTTQMRLAILLQPRVREKECKS
ncbi:hypothetical protein PHYBOEH_011279 [Phytophthora boehmeriae]|uniref:Uncharacterized protein n=1 Tax=Phytophthora boehmeriae TaxID=109152 RepID=A0A8T1VIM7_9STRA|nr:hypothetical protein PHYBOEH_011279 [Phytophthora boehmeriae]